jgi:hypothetical protein
MMRHIPKAVLVLLCGLLAGCATPPEVKQLSTAQIGYFDAAIKAVQVQADTLVAAAEKIAAMAEARIARIEKDNLDRLKKVAVETIPSTEAAKRGSIADKIFQSVTQTSNTSATAKAKLAADVAAIKAKTQDLASYIARMKDVQIALDAYLQSEKAGEKILQDILNQKDVKSLLGTVNGLLPKVTSATNDIQRLIGGLR